MCARVEWGADPTVFSLYPGAVMRLSASIWPKSTYEERTGNRCVSSEGVLSEQMHGVGFMGWIGWGIRIRTGRERACQSRAACICLGRKYRIG